ncbi:MAG: arginase family protein [Microbacterium sp.]|uniref:arginase family protein n=1 Tax=Microbacterium sp. TaxID=51671 RepID=UPI0039E34661
MTRFVVVPQWQGSSSPRAMALIDGAEAIAGDLPRSSSTRIDVPLEAGDARGGDVARLSALLQVRRAVDAELAVGTEPVLLVGGDCSVSVAGIAHAAARHGRIAVVWADAHPDLHSPASSTSHAFSGMSLRAVLGEGPDGLRLPSGAVAASDVVLVGTRSIDEPEAEFLAASGVRRVDVDALADPEAIAAAVAATGAEAVYVHVDVDVLDPAHMPGVKTAAPFGAQLPELVAALKRLREAVPVVGASLTEFVPASAADASADMGTLLRLVGSLA